MSEAVVDIQMRDNISIVTINRPEKRNAINDAVLDGLSSAARAMKKALPRAVVLTGKGDKAFSAGFDINPDNAMAADLGDAVTNNNHDAAQSVVNRLRTAIDEFISIPVPIIAAINGIAYGGGAEIAARCDLSVMSRSAAICFSEVTLGLMPDFGGGAKLSKLIGPSRAADLILTARKVGAEEALSLGLINRISDDASVLDDALVLARQIAVNGPGAVRSSLSVIRQSMNLSLNDALSYEKKKAVSLILSGECIHGVSAFFEKRVPDFPEPE